MKHIIFATMLAVAATAAAQTAPTAASHATAAMPSVIPAPAAVEQGQGQLWVGPALGVTGTAAKAVTRYLEMRDLSTASPKAKGATRLTANYLKEGAPEGYKLTIAPDGITLLAHDDRGMFYGVQTLTQLLSQTTDGFLPCCTITDEPRFGYRGLMLDLVRCYLPVEEVERLINAAAALKINNVHLHLTDDNGWRMEIKKYPRLTEVGAWRVDRPELFPARLNARSADEAATYGGFYTQKQLRQLVKYAAERHVNLVPEIEMPAHSAAAIASYPDLACPVVDKFVGVFPGIGGKDASIIICAGNPDSYRFYQDVLDEVMDVFPSPYIHLGGDEANKAMWEKCPRCNQALKDHGLKDFEELQAFFMDSINGYVRSKGRTAIGWDEVTYGDPAEPMVIMGWQGDGGVAVRDSRRSGRKFILTPAKTTYLIRYQGPQWFEPYTYFGNSTLRDVYDYEPVGADWTPELEANLIGMQGSLWGEFCRTAGDVQHQVFPRLLAVANGAWSPKGSHTDWPGFLRGVDALVPVLEGQGIVSAQSMWNIQHTVRPVGPGEVEITLECIRPDAEIRYTYGDSTMTAAKTYTGPICVTSSNSPTTLYATTYGPDGKMKGGVLDLPLSFNLATGASVKAENCRNGLAPVLTNGLRGRRNSDFEWAGWHNGTAEFTVDLGSVQPVREVTLGSYANADLCCAAPPIAVLYTSEDGNAFTLADTALTPATDVFHRGEKLLRLAFGPLRDTSARYLKVVALNPGAVPDGMAREGAPTWLYFDEITVK